MAGVFATDKKKTVMLKNKWRREVDGRNRLCAVAASNWNFIGTSVSEFVLGVRPTFQESVSPDLVAPVLMIKKPTEARFIDLSSGWPLRIPP